MYNNEQKIAYIKETGRKQMKPLFEKSFGYEHEHGKDVGEMTKAEFQAMMQRIGYDNIMTLNTESSKYQHYRQWCVSKKIPNSNNDSLNVEDKEKIRRNVKRYISYSEVEEGVKKLRNPCDKVLVLGIAEGLSLKADYSAFYQMDIDSFKQVDNQYFFLKNEIMYPISKQLYLYAQESVKCYDNYSVQKTTKWIGEYVIKSFPNETVGGLKNFRTKIRKRLREAQAELGWDSIDLFLSVQLSYLHDLCEKYNITIDDLLKEKEKILDFVEKFGSVTNNKKQLFLLEYKKSFPYEEYRYEKLKVSQGKKDRDFVQRKMNYSEWEEQKKILGELGEKFVYEHELERVEGYKLPQYKKVIWVSKDNGDGEGYDILSYDQNGNEIYIEVKTTRKGKSTPFYITNTELIRSIKEKEKYFLYRVYDFDIERETGVIAIYNGELTEMCQDSVLYKAFCE